MRKIFLLLFFLFIFLVQLNFTSATEEIRVKNAVLPRGAAGLSCVTNTQNFKIYCFGGEIGSNQWSSEIWEYDSINDTIIVKGARLPSPRGHMACAENSETHKIYCFGGKDVNKGILSEIVEYNSVIDQINIKRTLLPSVRSHFSCIENSQTHKIYCFGTDDKILEYDPSNDILRVMNSRLTPSRSALSCVEDSSTHTIYCLGGVSGSVNFRQIVEYNSFRDQLLVKTATLPTPRWALSCAGVKNSYKIYCFGGTDVNNGILSEIVEYNSQSDNNATLRPLQLPSKRIYLSCARNQENKINCFGGEDGLVLLNQIIEYSPINLPPFLKPIGNKVIGENRTLLLQLEATDPDNDTLLFSTDADSVLPSSFFFNQTSGLFRWTPTYRDQGVYNVTFSVTDGIHTTSEKITITVLDRSRHEIVIAGDPKIGTKINITSVDSDQPGRYYFLLMGLGNTGFNLSDGRHVPLDPDGLFYVSLAYPLFIGLLGSQGQLDGYGEATAIWDIPNIPSLAGLDVYFVFLTFDPGKKMPEAVLSISPSAKITLAP